MQDKFDFDASPDPGTGSRLDFERLDVYRVALEFQGLAASIALPAGRRELRDQLDRAALSILLNTAEGAGRGSAADQARFFSMARGSAMECAAVLDVLRATGLAPRPICLRGRSLLVRIVQMHTRLCQRGGGARLDDAFEKVSPEGSLPSENGQSSRRLQLILVFYDRCRAGVE